MAKSPKSQAEAKASRPHIPGYGIPTTLKGTLPWTFVTERLEQARNYWIASSGVDDQPHAVPVWGVYLDGVLYFGGGPQTQWSRNLRANPKVCVHLDSSDQAVILKGAVERIADPADSRMNTIDDAYQAKYAMRHGPPIWVLRLRVAFAWNGDLRTATRWQFGEG